MVFCSRTGLTILTRKGKQLVDALAKAAPEKAAEIAGSFLKNPTA